MRLLVAGVVVAVGLTLCLPRLTSGSAVDPDPAPESAAPELTLATEPLDGGFERILADAAGHRLDGGRVREVEIAPDGTVWVASGRRVMALGQPGVLLPRDDGWRSFPRRLALSDDGRVSAVEAGGQVVVRDGDVWSPMTDEGRTTADPWGLLTEPGVAPIEEVGIGERVPLRAVAVGREGDLWVLAGPDPRARPGQHLLLHHDADGWQVIGPDEGMPQERVGTWTDPALAAPVAMIVDHAGDLWFSVDRLGLWVLSESGFQRVEVPGLRAGALDIETGPDGSVWIASMTGRLYRAMPADLA